MVYMSILKLNFLWPPPAIASLPFSTRHRYFESLHDVLRKGDHSYIMQLTQVLILRKAVFPSRSR